MNDFRTAPKFSQSDRAIRKRVDYVNGLFPRLQPHFQSLWHEPPHRIMCRPLSVNSPSETRTSRKNWPRAALQALLHYGGSALVLFLLFRFLSGRKIWQTLETLPAHLWIFVLIGYLATHCIGVTKWRLMVSVAGSGMKWIQAARCYFAGLFGSLFLPSLIGGDLVRAGMAMRIGRSKAGVLLGAWLTGALIWQLWVFGGRWCFTCTWLARSERPADFSAARRDRIGWNCDCGGHRCVSSSAAILLSHEAKIRTSENRCSFHDATPGRGTHRAPPRSIGADRIHRFEHGSGGGMWIALGVSNMVVRVAPGETFGGNSAHPGRNRFARSGTCCTLAAIWSVCGSISRGRNCLGGNRYWRWPRGRVYLIPDDSIQFPAELTRQSSQKKIPETVSQFRGL